MKSINDIVMNVSAEAAQDLGSSPRWSFSEEQLEWVIKEARDRLSQQLSTTNTLDELAARRIWVTIVREAHESGGWNVTDKVQTTANSAAKRKSSPRRAFMRQVFMSMVPLKIAVVHFGSRYSTFPGEGWGYLLAISLTLSFGTLVWLAWKFRHIDL